jgi:hypothetical protein
MKLCAITNHLNKGYINEIITFNKILDSLHISCNDTYEFKTPNVTYGINKTYTHALIFLDYKISGIEVYKQFFNELKIPKIFIIDTIPHHIKKLNDEFIEVYINGMINSFNGLPIYKQIFLYDNYADGLIFLNNNDVNLFQQYYKLTNPKPYSVIPPPLGKKDQIKLNLDNINPNKNIGFNGYPSNHAGLFDLLNLIKFNPKYNLNLYGTHGRDDIMNEMIVNHLTSNSDRIKFNGRLKNDEKFFNDNHIYSNLSIYDTFDYYTFFSLLNGSIPLINETSGTSLFFKTYPFIVNNKIDSMSHMLDVISKTSIDDLKDIITKTFEDIKELNNENNYEQYKKFINTL